MPVYPILSDVMNATMVNQTAMPRILLFPLTNDIRLCSCVVCSNAVIHTQKGTQLLIQRKDGSPLEIGVNG